VHSFGIADFEAYQETDCFDAVISSVNVITHEEVVRVGRRSADAVQLHQIVPLAVDVSADGYGRADRLDICFEGERFSGFVAQVLHLIL